MSSVAIIGACVVVLLLGLAAGVAWGGRAPASPQDGGAPDAARGRPVASALRRYVRWCAVVLIGGPVAGIASIGVGGRLAMRLLAVTAGDGAQGMTTEADEVVGRITVDGTLGFVLFNGIVGGVVVTALYLAVRRFLPSGRVGAVGFGLALLAVFGAVVDPVRRGNPDFDIVGPGWVAVVVFVALAAVCGLVVAGVVARVSEWLPLPSVRPRVLVRYLPAAVAAVALFPFAAMMAAAGLVVVVWARLVPDRFVPGGSPADGAERAGRRLGGARELLVGRVVLALVVLAGLPNLIVNVVDIAGR